MFSATALHSAEPIAVCDSAIQQLSADKPMPKPVWFGECVSARLQGAGCYFMSKVSAFAGAVTYAEREASCTAKARWKALC